jgi:hypothetical protein
VRSFFKGLRSSIQGAGGHVMLHFAPWFDCSTALSYTPPAACKPPSATNSISQPSAPAEAAAAGLCTLWK